ncbi:MAG: hypothetical protein ISR46_01995, partial [Rhodospirillales bacterium]|nr:hypothetical protein [Rhodospirillales bacterium]
MDIFQSNRRWVDVGMATAFAVVLSDLLPEFLDNHNLTRAAQADVSAAGETALAARGGWYPELSVTVTG